MKNKFYFFGSQSRMFCNIALLAVIAFGIAACDSGFGSGAGTDSRLNGTWVDEDYWDILTFNNGNYEYSYRQDGVTYPTDKGTYTTSGSILTEITTHYNLFNLDSEKMFGIKVYSSGWYSRADLKALGVAEEYLDYWFSPYTMTYSISGNLLYLTHPSSGDTYVYTRR